MCEEYFESINNLKFTIYKINVRVFATLLKWVLKLKFKIRTTEMKLKPKCKKIVEAIKQKP